MAGDDQSEDGRTSPDYGDAIEAAIFEQILEMDDDEDDREFSSQIVFDFFTQAATTFVKMNEALASGDLQALSDLGHFLKGSSATLGLIRVKDGCEKIQHWGLEKDEHGERVIERADCLKFIRDILPQVRSDCEDAENRLKRFYGET